MLVTNMRFLWRFLTKVTAILFIREIYDGVLLCLIALLLEALNKYW